MAVWWDDDRHSSCVCGHWNRNSTSNDKEATLPKKHHKNVVWKTSEDYKDTKEKFEMIETFPRLLNELKTNISMLTWRG